MTVAQDSYSMGYNAVEAAVNALNGDTPDTFIDSGSSVITEENVEKQLEKLESIS